jgi:RNA polymerase sigma factor for flagellar operon FliA
MVPATHTASLARLSTERRRLVREHLGLVQDTLRQVGRRLPAHVDRDDLYGAGAAALVDAGLRFDAGRAVEFPAFAAKRVRGAMLDELRRWDWAARSVRTRHRCRARAVEALQARLGREPRATEVAAALGIGTDQVHLIDSDTGRATVRSLDDDATSVHDVPATTTPADVVVTREVHRHLRAAVDALPDRERHAVAGHFLHERPMRELAAELGVTESRVSQLRKRGLALLHESLAPYLLEQAEPATGTASTAQRARYSVTPALSRATSEPMSRHSGDAGPVSGLEPLPAAG